MTLSPWWSPNPPAGSPRSLGEGVAVRPCSYQARREGRSPKGQTAFLLQSEPTCQKSRNKDGGRLDLTRFLNYSSHLL